MTNDDLIRMAREAGFSEWAVQTPQDLERFAALVSAAEREACAQVCEDNKGGMSSYFKGEYAAAIRARGSK